jgi:hypothetical protein
VRIHRPHRSAKIPLAACLAASGLALAAGCSAAPAGAADDSPAIGPVKTGAAAAKFAPFPVPTKWAGAGGKDYTAAVKAKTGTTPRKFSLTAAPSLVFWLSCIGTGTARLTSPAISLNWGIPCGSGDDPSGITITPPRAAQGTSVKVEVTSPPNTRWEVRIDARDTPHKKA